MRKTPHRESGIGLLLLLVLTGILAVLVIVNLLPKQPTEQERERITQEALARAKDALIAYAVAHMDRPATQVNVPGYLPCPVTTRPTSAGDEGNTPLTCGARGVTILGVLPFKTLGVEPIRDGYGECLWYAVSGTFKIGDGGTGDATRAPMVNWDTPGQIRVLASDGVTVLAGAPIESLAAAVVIAPGRPRGQSRVPAAHTTQCQNDVETPGAYLESDASLLFEANPVDGNTSTLATPWAVTTFVNGRTSTNAGEPIVNDRILTLSPREIFDAVSKRKESDLIGTVATPGKLRVLALRVAECLASYSVENRDLGTDEAKDRRLVWAAPIGQTAFQDFADSSKYQDVPNQMQGRVPYRIRATGGRPEITMQFVTDTGCGPSAFTHWNQELENWWEHWKDQLFYVASPNFAPETIPAPPASSPVDIQPNNVKCEGQCLTVNGLPAVEKDRYAGIVIFANRPLSTQRRVTPAERSNPQNYLDGVNWQDLPAADAALPRRDFASGAESNAFNDLAVCIRFPENTPRDPIVTFC